MELQDFLSRNNISGEEWGAAAIDWADLKKIYVDFQGRRRQLEDAAEFVVKSIQSYEGVHSVRWRVKDPEHLLEKIVRKRSEKSPSKKYMGISVDNYMGVITDLVGVRALHLFKDQVFNIHDKIKGAWGLSEKPVSYIREGDHSDLVVLFKEKGITPKIHKSGYRSVHYILKMKPNLDQVLIELQVRTIFEEGWSEIDHKVRYPNFSDNKQLESILKIFNRLAGSADEIGSFIRGLSIELSHFEDQLRDAAEERDQAAFERDEALRDAQSTLDELDAMSTANSASSAKVKALQLELKKLSEKINTSERARSKYWAASSSGASEALIREMINEGKGLPDYFLTISGNKKDIVQ
ncbi:RelA/SpoT domain-containing protein [Pseudomonas putida]|uniref:RelA/SpoT domain-containing protein n=1 Tax=Pseudomonas putida TaxID=303 RepID=UPI001E55DEC5|nr:hypothetical protein [Pseudomonas putida]MCE0880731.1 hypothetical protein [Pseudomonas putida]